MIVSSAKKETALSVSQAKNVYAGVMAIVNSPTKNMVRFPANYEAENKGNAQTAKALGESGRGKGQGVGREVSQKTTGLAYNKKGGKLTVLLSVKDMTHRQNSQQSGGKEVNDRKFEWAARTIADLTDPDRLIDYLEICDNGKTWRRVSFAHLPIFPTLSEENAEAFVAGKLDLLNLGKQIELLNARCTTLKKKANMQSVKNDKGTCCYVPPTGYSTMIVDAKGEKIPSVKREVKRGMLWADASENAADYFPAEWLDNGKLSNNLNMLPTFMLELQKKRAEYESLNSLVRPFECGIIEKEMQDGELCSETVTVAGTVFEIHITEDTEYDKPADCAAKIESGEYTEKQVPSSRGSWEVHAKIKEKVAV